MRTLRRTSAWLVALLATACAASPAPQALQERDGLQLFVLGIAQDGGLPHLGCEQACCTEARRTGRVLYPASLGVVDRATGKLLLVEATPRVEEQVALLHDLAAVHGRDRQPVDALLLTHAHIGHYLGLAHFGREVAASKELPTWCSPRMAGFLREHGPWRQLVDLGQLQLHELPARTATTVLPGLEVTATPVPHRDEFSDTMAFKLRGPRRCVLFVPDVDAWDRAPGLLDELLSGVDVAYVDGTFHDGSGLRGRALAEVRHPLMTDTMTRLAAFAREHPGAVRFIHLNHSNPALHDPKLRAEIEARGFAIAARGEAVEL